jgi:hypothetical protein
MQSTLTVVTLGRLFMGRSIRRWFVGRNNASELFDGPVKMPDVRNGALSNLLANPSRTDAQGAFLILAKLVGKPIAFAATPPNVVFNRFLISIVVVHLWAVRPLRPTRETRSVTKPLRSSRL